MLLYYAIILAIPSQLGKHFWPSFTSISGLRIDYLSPTIYITDILIVLLFLVWAFRISKKVTQKTNVKITLFKSYKKSFGIFLFFCLYLLVSIYIGGNILRGLYFFGKFLEYSFFGFFISQTLKERKQLVITGVLFSIGIIGESLLAFGQYVNQGSLGGLFYYIGERTFTGETPGIAQASLNGQLVLRPYGSFPHPNVLAAYLVFGMIFILFNLPKKQKSILCTLFYLSLFIGTVGLLLTMGRTAIVFWVIFLIFALVRFLHIHLTSRNFFKTLIGLFFGLVCLFALFLTTPYAGRFTQLSFSDQSVTQREMLADASYKMIIKNPLFGVGLGNFLDQLARIEGSALTWENLQPVHNIFLLAAAETGGVGLLFFLVFISKTIMRLVRLIRDRSNQKEYISFLILLIAVLFLGFDDHYFLTLQQGQLLLSFVFGLCWTSIRVM